MSLFSHLRLHTEYSIVDGLVTIEELVIVLRQMNSRACAITDQGNLFGAIKFYKACEAAGVKPIIGADLWVEKSRLTLLCQNLTGYRHLTQLISKAYLEGQKDGIPRLEKRWFEHHTEGLIALSGGREGDIGQAILSKKNALAEKLLQEWQVLFPDRFYVEIQRVGKPEEEFYNEEAVEMAAKYQVPVIASNDVRFLHEDDFEAHEARVCIHEGMVLNDPRRVKTYTPEQYLKTPEEMAKLFSDIPEALENTVEIAKRCNLILTLDKVFLPDFPVPASFTIENFLSQKAHEGLQKRLKNQPEKNIQAYEQRLKIELEVINPMGFAGYFLIVADFIVWAKNHDIPVGPGRGSGAGSLVAYALDITDIDPLPYDLLFERFLNPERISMPDFDIDFCMDGRDRVIDYVAEKYGRYSVSQIITFGTMAAKAVVRDVGRVLGHPYGFVDKIAKLIPFELGMTLDKALTQEADLGNRYEKEEEVKTLIDLAKKLEGLTRNAGKHAGGVVISPSALTDFTPLYCEAGEASLVSQFDKDDVEKVGLVKFDFLGLRTLTIIHWAIKNILRSKKIEVKINEIALDDKACYTLIKACQTTAVFQLESRGMKDLIKRLQPDCFEDIIALVALFRPGPLQSGMVDDFIARKHGRAAIEYSHPLLEPILKPTYGIIVYQEQVMQIAQTLAGYTLGAADLLRRAMGKKKPEEMAKQRAIFMTGALKNQVPEKCARDIFDLMEKFAGYGFNKSHSAAYALVSYQTAWLKAHYPAEFMAAVLSSDMDKTEKVVNFLHETRRMNLKIIPPEVNQSHYHFTVVNGEILYGLGAIKGAGEAAISLMIENRETEGLFKDFVDFCLRVDLKKVNRRVMEAFIKSGAFDCLGLSRAMMMGNLDRVLKTESAASKKQRNLFEETAHASIELLPMEEWAFLERLKNEKETLGFYQSGHPLALYEAELSQVISQETIAGFVAGMKTMFTKRGDRMAFLTLEERHRNMEITIFSELFEKSRPILIKDQLLIVEGEVSKDDFTGGEKLLARNLYSIDQFREKYAKGLLLDFQSKEISEKDILSLCEMLSPHQKGFCPVFVNYRQDQVLARFQLGEKWRLQLKGDLIQKLKQKFGETQVKVMY
jgi:DNA polymerase-3 subunit alpha